MENVKIGICVKEEKYGQCFAYELAKQNRKFMVHIFNEEILECLKKSYDVDFFSEKALDLILVEYSYIKDIDKTTLPSNIMYLIDKMSVEELEMLEKNKDENPFIYMYGNIQEAINRIVFFLSAVLDKHIFLMGKHSSKTVVFLGASGGAGCTTASLGLGRELVQYRGKEALYISLEDFPSVEPHFNMSTQHHCMGEYIYAMVDIKKLPIEIFLVEDAWGVKGFKYEGGRNQILLLDIDDFIKFINTIIDEANFDYIIFDGGKFDDKLLWLIGECDNICVVEPKKYDNYDENINGRTESLLNYLDVILNMNQDKDRKNNVYTFTNIFREDGKVDNLNIDGDFGVEVKRLTNNIMGII